MAQPAVGSSLSLDALTSSHTGSLIEVFPPTRGHSLASLHERPQGETRALMTATTLHASMPLTEVESRAHFIDGIKGDADFAGKG